MLAKPENREEAVASLLKSVGGKLIGWYLTFGHTDWLVIGEFPDNVETTVAMTAEEATATFEAAGKAAKGAFAQDEVLRASSRRHGG